MGCCLVLLATWLSPRIILFLLWLATDWTLRGFQTRLWPFLGFLFLPFTTLFYLIAMRYQNFHFDNTVIFWAIVGLVFDLVLTGWLRKRTC